MKRSLFLVWVGLLMVVLGCASTETVSTSSSSVSTSSSSTVSTSSPSSEVSTSKGSYCSPQAEEYIDRALEYGKKNNFDTALSYFNKAIADSPRCARACVARGLVLSWKDRYDEAIADSTKAIELGLKNLLAEFYYWRGKSYGAKHRDDDAIADFTKAIELGLPKENLAMAYYFRGKSYFLKERYNKAIADLNQAIELGLKGDVLKSAQTLLDLLKTFQELGIIH